jgi:hypothetical protein
MRFKRDDHGVSIKVTMNMTTENVIPGVVFLHTFAFFTRDSSHLVRLKAGLTELCPPQSNMAKR